ncbi:MAG: translation termination inhibitor protein itt1 [Stictis urceolatum]|nr:translation termination inhibitor protein itt1 [Stictis urceolata]
MADDQELGDDERTTELSAISCIFPELEVDPSNAFVALLEISVSPAPPLPIIFPPLVGSAPPISTISISTEETNGDAIGTDSQVRLLSHFPPLKLGLNLPDGYPSSFSPVVTLKLETPYLSQEKLQNLRDHAYTLWEDNGHSEVLYDYIDYLQQAAEDGFGLRPQSGEPLRLSQELELALLDFDLKTKRAKFEQETFECGVCLEPKKGAVCHKLSLCGHVFCKSCMQDFYNNCITEGDVFSVKCMDTTCEKNLAPKNLPPSRQGKKRRKKVDRTLTPSELLEIPLEQDQVHRYVLLKRKKELEANKNTIYCPRKWCQGAARPTKKSSQKAEEEDDSDSEEEPEENNAENNARGEDAEIEKVVTLPPPSERLAVCSECSFAFCSVCRQGWHGEIVICLPPRSKRELTAEEKASEDYLTLHSTRCPTCDSRCQKSHGCNHMHCFMCETHFCYLCTAWLDEANPYKHFNTEGTPCYQRLWEMEEGDNGGAALQQPPAPDGNNLQRNANNNIHEIRIEEPPPPAPVPPAPPGGRNNAPPWEAPPGVRINRRAQQGLVRGNGGANQPNGQNGLQRFLEMVQDDREDEWDSDELEDDDFDIPIRVR